MAEFTRTPAVFVLATLLRLTASAPRPAAVVELGSPAVLPCPALTGGSGCGGVTWVFRRSQDSVDPGRGNQGRGSEQQLVRDGQLVDVSGRMELLPNCSLLLHRVAEEDVGLYSCSHSHPAPKRGLPTVSLSVLKALGRDALGGAVRCALSSPQSSRFRVSPAGSKHLSQRAKHPRSNVWCSVTDKLTGRVWPFTRTERNTEEPTSTSHKLQVSSASVAVALSVLLLFT